jgi:hypothetical protein
MKRLDRGKRTHMPPSSRQCEVEKPYGIRSLSEMDLKARAEFRAAFDVRKPGFLWRVTRTPVAPARFLSKAVDFPGPFRTVDRSRETATPCGGGSPAFRVPVCVAQSRGGKVGGRAAVETQS